MSEQKKSLQSTKQPKLQPEPKAKEDEGKGSNTINEGASSSSSLSDNESSNSLKRPLVDEAETVKTNRPVENIDNDDNIDRELINNLMDRVKNLNAHDYSIIVNELKERCDNTIISQIFESYTESLEEMEKMWEEKCTLLSRELKDLYSISQMHNIGLRVDNFGKPHTVKRTVGLQTSIPQEIQEWQIPCSSKKHSTTQVDSSSVSFNKQSQLPQTSSSYMGKKSSTTGSTQLMSIPIDPSPASPPLLPKQSECNGEESEK